MYVDQKVLEEQIAFYTKLNEVEVVMALRKVWDNYYGIKAETKPTLVLVEN